MITLEELLKKGKKVIKGEKKKPKENEIRKRYNLDALMEIAKRSLKRSEAYKYPHREFAEVVGFEPIGKIQKSTSDGLVTGEYNISLPKDLRDFIESGPIDGFDDTVRIRMSRDDGKVVVEPFKEYQKRVKQKRFKAEDRNKEGKELIDGALGENFELVENTALIPTIKELADEIGWDVQNLSNHFKNKDMPPKLVIEKLAKTSGFDIVKLDSVVKETQQKTERIKHLLLFLEEELRCFRNGSKDARDILEKK